MCIYTYILYNAYIYIDILYCYIYIHTYYVIYHILYMDHGDCMKISMELSNLNMATWGVSSRCRTTLGGEKIYGCSISKAGSLKWNPKTELWDLIQCEAVKIAKLVYNSNNYGVWYL